MKKLILILPLLLLIFLSIASRSIATYDVTAINSTQIQFTDPQVGPFDEVLLSSPNYFSNSVSCTENHICTATFNSYTKVSRIILRIAGRDVFGDNSVNWIVPGTTPTPVPPTNTPTPTPSNAFQIFYDPDYNNYSFTNTFSTNPVNISATSTNSSFINPGSSIANALQCSNNICKFNGFYSFEKLSQHVYSIRILGSNGITLYEGPVTFPIATPTPTPANQLRVSGQFKDADGNGLNNNVLMTLTANFAKFTSKNTDINGNFSLPIIPQFEYVQFSAITSPSSVDGFKTPNNFTIEGRLYYPSLNTTLNITLPVKKVLVHVRNQAGDVIPAFVASQAKNNIDLTPIFIDGLVDVKGYASDNRTTDSNGDATMWLLTKSPSTDPIGYTITAKHRFSHPAYKLSEPQGISLVNDTELNFVVPFSHAQPVTTATLSPAPDAQGVSLTPVTVTLSSIAVSGFSISNRKYKIDGGATQTYTAPFAVSGNGTHTIEYWATDNLAVYETRKTKTFTINQNQAPVINSLANQTVNLGSAYTANGSFNDADSTSWTATVDYGEGQGPQPLMLNNKNFTLNHNYNSAGVKTVTVKVTDDEGAFDTETTTITVNNPPQISTVAGDSILKGQSYTTQGSFTDTDSTSWNATVNYGDGSGQQALLLSGNNFTLNHAYNTAGSFTVTIEVTDNQGAQSTKNTIVLVDAPPQIDALAEAHINIGATYSETKSFTDPDSTSWTATVDYGEGAEPQTLTLNGTNFTLNHLYLAPGTHTIIVKVQDNQGANTTTTTTVTIHDVEPVTNVSLSPHPDEQNEYPNPVTVTLQATADTGYTIANTYYTIDGGSQQTYTAPFAVSGPGTHTVTYWSIDSLNLEETPHKAQTFTVSNNAIASTLPTGEDQSTTVGNAILTFSDVTTAGHVVQTTSSNNQGGPLPSQYRLLGTYYNLTTTSTYNGTITITFSYNPADVNNPNQLKLFHYNGSNWENITTSVDTINHTITGITTSLSPFAIAEEDTTSPILTNFQLSPYVIANGSSATISVNAQDDLTGVQSVSYSLTSSSGQVTPGNLSLITPSGSWQALVSPTTGVYAIKLTVTDFAGNQKTSDNLYLAVYDASAGHVTGGGWVSPDNTTIIGITSGGKANYGFNIKYLNGSSTPQGNFSMNYKQDNLEFKSISFEWLTVSSGTADFQGQATVNGTSNYTFRGHIVDGSPDQFDIRVWDNSNSYNNPDYRISNSVGGGSIVIHQ